MDDRAIAPSKNRVATSWAQLLCVQYSPLLTFEDVIEKRRATRPPLRLLPANQHDGVVVQDRIVGQPFLSEPSASPSQRPVADPEETAGETMPGLLAVC
jgi:hypothetical protein